MDWKNRKFGNWTPLQLEKGEYKTRNKPSAYARAQSIYAIPWIYLLQRLHGQFLNSRHLTFFLKISKDVISFNSSGTSFQILGPSHLSIYRFKSIWDSLNCWELKIRFFCTFQVPICVFFHFNSSSSILWNTWFSYDVSHENRWKIIWNLIHLNC